MIRLNTHKTKVLLIVCSSILVFCSTSYSQTASSNRFKRIDYEYDLVSGKVNKVSYQKDSADQFIHQYSYDADNRITKVETSSDNVVWDVDAKYFYYAHGPLARTEIGNDKVQGIDYAYTLQGWIKGVNSNTLDKKRDMGQDGKDTSIYDLSNPQLHKHFAQDAYGYSLNYFKGDYKAIGTIRWNNASNRFESVTTGSGLMQQTHDLFNGNIKSMVTAITQIDTSSAGNVNPQIPKPLGSAYKYDQLNRIKKSVSFTNIDLIGNLWQSSGQTIANMYGNTFSYDANGNILTQNRSDETGQEFEALNYKYRTVAGKLRQNRLYHVNDNTSYTSLKTDDIDDQGHFAAGASSSSLIDSVGQFNNYSYDNIGNLVKDKAEQIANIEWTVYGKVKRILRTVGSGKDNLVFDYDPNGNRIAKHVYDNANNWKYTVYYVRDAQGNVMCTYEHKNIPPPGGIGSPSMSFVLQEQHIYGNSRLGMYIPNKQLINQSGFTIGFKSHVLGKKLFEMGNHLGNVLTVVSDRKMPIDNNSDGVIDEYQVDLLTSNDFSPFGVKLYKRGSSLGNYRYGMNGQEKDDEIVGSGNMLDFEFRMYDSRLGRFLSVDPLSKTFPMLTPYQFASNRPIDGVDLDGKEWKSQHKWGDAITDKTLISKLGSDYVKGMTYADAYSKRAPAILNSYVEKSQKSGFKADCANLCFDVLVDFASTYKLPLKITDYRDPKKVFDNDKMTYKTSEDLKTALGNTFGAATLFSDKNPIMENVSNENIKTGDVLTWQYMKFWWTDEKDRNYHASTVSGITTDEITVTQGSLDQGKPTPVETKTYEKNSDGSPDGPWDINQVKAKRWNFSIFDKKKEGGK